VGPDWTSERENRHNAEQNHADSYGPAALPLGNGGHLSGEYIVSSGSEGEQQENSAPALAGASE